MSIQELQEPQLMADPQARLQFLALEESCGTQTSFNDGRCKQATNKAKRLRALSVLLASDVCSWAYSEIRYLTCKAGAPIS